MLRRPAHCFFQSALHTGRSPNTKLVRVSSIDHDGCIGIPDVNPTETVIYHQDIIAQLNDDKQKLGFHFDYVMSSSSRQTIQVDCFNAMHNRNNLVFPVAHAFARKINAYYDPFWLADIIEGKKPGHTISLLNDNLTSIIANPRCHTISDRILQSLMDKHTTQYCLSEDKINIIYAQAHRIALLHPDAFVEFNMYDNLIETVLNPLSQFYLTFSQCLPKNLKLSLYHYDSDQPSTGSALTLPSLVNSIDGTGKPDEQYYNTVNTMTQIARDNEGNQPTYHMVNYLNPSHLFERNAATQRK